MMSFENKMIKYKLRVLSICSLLIGAIYVLMYFLLKRNIINIEAPLTQQLVMEQQITTTMMPEARVQMCRFGCLKKVHYLYIIFCCCKKDANVSSLKI